MDLFKGVFMRITGLIFTFFMMLGSSAYSATSSDKNFDAHFLDKMTKHHKDGIYMAKMAQTKTSNKMVLDMSKKMIEDQQKEIQQMQKWRNDLYSNVPKSTELPEQMKMSELKNAKGEEFDKKYLSMMSKHHESGIRMFEEAEEKASNSQIKEFAMKASEKQAQEQDHMKHMKMNHSAE